MMAFTFWLSKSASVPTTEKKFLGRFVHLSRQGLLNYPRSHPFLHLQAVQQK